MEIKEVGDHLFISMDTEYRSPQKVVGELVWLSRLLSELNVPFPKNISVFCDSQSAMNTAKNPVFHE